MEQNIDQIISRFREFVKQPGWNRTRLAREAGLAVNGLIDLFEPGFNPSANTIRKVEVVIDRYQAGEST